MNIFELVTWMLLVLGSAAIRHLLGGRAGASVLPWLPVVVVTIAFARSRRHAAPEPVAAESWELTRSQALREACADTQKRSFAALALVFGLPFAAALPRLVTKAWRSELGGDGRLTMLASVSTAAMMPIIVAGLFQLRRLVRDLFDRRRHLRWTDETVTFVTRSGATTTHRRHLTFRRWRSLVLVTDEHGGCVAVPGPIATRGGLEPPDG